jgi:hypothetical protein
VLEDRAGELEVVEQRARGGGRIVRDARLEEPSLDLAVLPLLARRGEQCRAEALRAMPGLPNQGDQPRRRRRP